MEDIKQKLMRKNWQELAEFKNKDSFKTIMRNFDSMIWLGNFNDKEIEKMVKEPKLLENLAKLWLEVEDERIMELHEKMIKEFVELCD